MNIFIIRHKRAILFLCVILVIIIVGYYQFIDTPIRQGIAEARAEYDAVQLELATAQNKILHFNQMQEELKRLTENSIYSPMPSYNASDAEIAMLNNIFRAAMEYSVTFSDISREGDQVRRNFNLQFTARNFTTAANIISNLTNGEYRCIIKNISCQSVSDTNKYQNYYDYLMGDVIENGTEDLVKVSASATFYETMVGGTPDIALPDDSLSKNES